MSQVDEIVQLLRGLPGEVSHRLLSEGDNPEDGLSTEETSALSDRAVSSRAESFRLGRSAARDALEQLGVGRPSIGVGSYRQPLWPDGIVGSITHTRSIAIAAVGRESEVGGIGVDLEALRPFDGLKRHVAFGDELKWLDRLGGAEADVKTIEIFSAKEAIFKAFYPRVQRFFGFDSASVEPTDSGDHYVGRLAHDLDARYPPSRTFRISVGWAGDLILAALILEPD